MRLNRASIVIASEAKQSNVFGYPALLIAALAPLARNDIGIIYVFGDATLVALINMCG